MFVMMALGPPYSMLYEVRHRHRISHRVGLNEPDVPQPFAPLLADERLGHVWFIQADSIDVGYGVVTLSYSMEYGGPSAIADDLFIQPAFRGAGLGKAALAEVCSFCAGRGVRLIDVETGHDNSAALALYHRAGFVETNRVHLRLQLAEPTHCPMRTPPSHSSSIVVMMSARMAVHRTHLDTSSARRECG